LTLQLAEAALHTADRRCDARGVEHYHGIAARTLHVAMHADPADGLLGLCTAFLAGNGQFVGAYYFSDRFTTHDQSVSLRARLKVLHQLIAFDKGAALFV
jgi:hypothetical protein